VTDSRQAPAFAQAAADAIRGLNHAGGGLGQPSDAYDVLGSLSLAASRLGQALARVTRFLDQALADGRLGHDLGEDPCFAVETAGLFLDDARASAAALAGHLGAAQQQLALINGRPCRKDPS
jgi:malonyl CoA-acyl carrier protein transacylase